MIGEFCILRTYSAGVHTGIVKSLSKDCKLVTLTNARRIHRWKGANTLNEIANKGCDLDYTRISEPVPEIMLTEVIEIIPCSKIARDNLETSRWC